MLNPWNPTNNCNYFVRSNNFRSPLGPVTWLVSQHPNLKLQYFVYDSVLYLHKLNTQGIISKSTDLNVRILGISLILFRIFGLDLINYRVFSIGLTTLFKAVNSSNNTLCYITIENSYFSRYFPGPKSKFSLLHFLES